MTIQGCDYSFSRPSIAALAPYAFVVRYLSPDPSKNLSAEERDALFAAGKSIVLVWESTGTDAQQGYNAGLADTQAARAQAQPLGFPADLPIYFAIDYDVTTPAQSAGMLDYLYGCADAAGNKNLVGVYGSELAVNDAYDSGFRWLWQTYAWSDGGWAPEAVLRQVQNGVTLDGATVDLDVATTGNFGQWTPPGVSVPVLGGYAYRATHNLHTPIAVDGVFGPNTAKALQYVVGAAVDGDWGPDSWACLTAMLGLPKGSAQSTVVVHLQKALDVAEDGDWGPQTTLVLQKALNTGVLA